jgi:hypothetical protein
MYRAKCSMRAARFCAAFSMVRSKEVDFYCASFAFRCNLANISLRAFLIFLPDIL